MPKEQEILSIAEALIASWRANQIFGSLYPADDFTDAQLVAGVVVELRAGTPKGGAVDQAYKNLSTNAAYYSTAAKSSKWNFETAQAYWWKDGTFMGPFSYGEHLEKAESFLSPKKLIEVRKQYGYDAKGWATGEDANPEGFTNAILKNAKALGWVRVYVLTGDVVYVGTSDDETIASILRSLKEPVKWIVPDKKKDVQVDEGETAEQAWRRRNSIRKRVKAEQEPIQDTLVFDFDDTICKNLPNHKMGPPIEGIVERLKRAKEAGIKIIIQSGRWSVNQINTPEQAEKNKKEAIEWLKKYDVPYDELRGGKELAIGYVDDKAIPANDLSKLDHTIDKAIEGGLTAAEGGPNPIYVTAALPPDLLEKIRTWGKENINDENVYTAPSNNSKQAFGRENEPHVTVIYGADDGEDGEEIEEFLAEYVKTPLQAKLGEISKFKTWESEIPCDVLKIVVESEDLKKLHAALKERFGDNGKFPEYRPHVTISYVNPGACDDMEGLKDFEGAEFQIDSFDCVACEKGEGSFEHPVEIEGVLDQHGLAASMIDFPHESLPTDLWQKLNKKDYKLLPEAKQGIEKEVMDLLGRVFSGHTDWAKTIYLQGSSATQFYVANSDVDIQVIVDVAELKAANSVLKDMSSARAVDEANEILEKHDKEASWHGHPIEIRLRDEKKKDDKVFISEVDALYDLGTDEWIKKPKLVNHLTYSRKTTVGPAMNRALSVSKQWDLLLGDIRRNLEEAKVALSYYNTEPTEPKKDLESYVRKLMNKVATAIKKLRKERKQIRLDRKMAAHDRRHLRFDLINTHPDVVLMKLLVEWGYFQKVLDLARYAKNKDYKLELGDAQPLLDLLEGKTHMRDQDVKAAAKTTVFIPGYVMDYYSDGRYIVHTHTQTYPGVYDALLTKKYNSLPKEQLQIELTKDLQSWANKLTHGGERQEEVAASLESEDEVTKQLKEYFGNWYWVVYPVQHGHVDYRDTNNLRGLVQKFYLTKSGEQLDWKTVNSLKFPALVKMAKSVWGEANKTIEEYFEERKREDEEAKKEANEYLNSIDIEGVLDIHAVSDDQLYKTAITEIQNDPKWADYHLSPEVAKELGEAQQALSDARSTIEIQQAWEAYEPSLSFQELVKRAEAKEQEK